MVLPPGKAITYVNNRNGQVSSITRDGSPSSTILNNVESDPIGLAGGVNIYA